MVSAIFARWAGNLSKSSRSIFPTANFLPVENPAWRMNAIAAVYFCQYTDLGDEVAELQAGAGPFSAIVPDAIILPRFGRQIFLPVYWMYVTQITRRYLQSYCPSQLLGPQQSAHPERIKKAAGDW